MKLIIKTVKGVFVMATINAMMVDMSRVFDIASRGSTVARLDYEPQDETAKTLSGNMEVQTGVNQARFDYTAAFDTDKMFSSMLEEATRALDKEDEEQSAQRTPAETENDSDAKSAAAGEERLSPWGGMAPFQGAANETRGFGTGVPGDNEAVSVMVNGLDGFASFVNAHQSADLATVSNSEENAKVDSIASRILENADSEEDQEGFMGIATRQDEEDRPLGLIDFLKELDEQYKETEEPDPSKARNAMFAQIASMGGTMYSPAPDITTPVYNDRGNFWDMYT